MRAPSKPEPRLNRLCRSEFGNTNYFPAVMSDLKQSARVISPCRMRGCTVGMHARSSPAAGLLRCSWGEGSALTLGTFKASGVRVPQFTKSDARLPLMLAAALRKRE